MFARSVFVVLLVFWLLPRPLAALLTFLLLCASGSVRFVCLGTICLFALLFPAVFGLSLVLAYALPLVRLAATRSLAPLREIRLPLCLRGKDNDDYDDGDEGFLIHDDDDGNEAQDAVVAPVVVPPAAAPSGALSPGLSVPPPSGVSVAAAPVSPHSGGMPVSSVVVAPSSPLSGGMLASSVALPAEDLGVDQAGLSLVFSPVGYLFGPLVALTTEGVYDSWDLSPSVGDVGSSVALFPEGLFDGLVAPPGLEDFFGSSVALTTEDLHDDTLVGPLLEALIDDLSALSLEDIPGSSVGALAPLPEGSVGSSVAPNADGLKAMDVDDDGGEEDGHVHGDLEGVWDPMDIREDATMTLRRGGWRRMTALIRHGCLRRLMALPLDVPAHKFAGPYIVPWYKGSSSDFGRL
ncbi:hypothetical protein K501DRAFT_267348 [Backusella circina FSU 941]|nr:hypothetical protein K501DRAFT_267348 [Backusella circina FSU 941]